MAIKCGNCGHRLPDTVIEQKCTEFQINAASNMDLGKSIANFWGNVTGKDKGEDILNRFEYQCPTCQRIHQWIGFSD
jgi:hypothetical protein